MTPQEKAKAELERIEKSVAKTKEWYSAAGAGVVYGVKSNIWLTIAEMLNSTKGKEFNFWLQVMEAYHQKYNNRSQVKQ